MLQASHVEYIYNSLNYVVIDEEGYLLDPSDWSRAFTQGRARAADIELSTRHWQLIEIIRDKYLRLGSLPLMRLVCKAAGFEKQELKQHFGSCLNLWKLAGLPNPGAEAKAYMG